MSFPDLLYTHATFTRVLRAKSIAAQRPSPPPTSGAIQAVEVRDSGHQLQSRFIHKSALFEPRDLGSVLKNVDTEVFAQRHRVCEEAHTITETILSSRFELDIPIRLLHDGVLLGVLDSAPLLVKEESLKVGPQLDRESTPKGARCDRPPHVETLSFMRAL